MYADAFTPSAHACCVVHETESLLGAADVQRLVRQNCTAGVNASMHPTSLVLYALPSLLSPAVAADRCLLAQHLEASKRPTGAGVLWVA